MISVTKIYSYGCLPPAEGMEVFEDQLRKAHQYRNRLVEIERERREGIARVQSSHDTLGPLLQLIDHVEEQISEWRKEARASRSGGGDKVRLARLREQIEEWSFDLRVLRGLRTWHKDTLRVAPEAAQYELVEEAKASPSLTSYIRPWQRLAMAIYATESGDRGARLRCEYDACNDMAAAHVRAARASCGLASGTYLVVEASTERWRSQPEAPRFLRYQGEGRLAVQLQGGMTVEELETGTDPRLRLLPATPRKDQTHVPRDARTLAIRIARKDGVPVWAHMPVRWHRPLPADAKIMWAWVIRRRHGVRYRYDVQLTIRSESLAVPERPAAAAIALDIGCRDLPGGELRVATWLDSHGVVDELRLPQTRRASPTRRVKGRPLVPWNDQKIRDLQAIRDERLDNVKLELLKRRKGPVAVSDWYREETQYADRWRSPARVAILRREWKKRITEGTEVSDDTLVLIEAYLAKDRHLLDWQTNQRRRDLGRRKDLYRSFAAQMTRRYDTVIVARRDYRREAQRPEDGPQSEGHEGRVMLRSAAPGDLRDALKLAAAARGCRFVEVDIDGDTAWATDWKVCHVMLRASGQAVEGLGEPLATNKAAITQEQPGPAQRRRRLGNDQIIDPLAEEDTSI